MPVKITLDPEFSGSLSSFGYHMRDPTSTRWNALADAMTFWGSTYVIRKLNVLYIYNKYRYPENAKIFKTDLRWVQKMRNTMNAATRAQNKAKHSQKTKNKWLANPSSCVGV